MHNVELARGTSPGRNPGSAPDTLFDGGGWADVVRESQEVVELALKGLLRGCGIEAPRIHDVSEVLFPRTGPFPGIPRRRCRTSRGNLEGAQARPGTCFHVPKISPLDLLPAHRRHPGPRRCPDGSSSA